LIPWRPLGDIELAKPAARKQDDQDDQEDQGGTHQDRDQNASQSDNQDRKNDTVGKTVCIKAVCGKML